MSDLLQPQVDPQVQEGHCHQGQDPGRDQQGPVQVVRQVGRAVPQPRPDHDRRLGEVQVQHRRRRGVHGLGGVLRDLRDLGEVLDEAAVGRYGDGLLFQLQPSWNIKDH